MDKQNIKIDIKKLAMYLILIAIIITGAITFIVSSPKKNTKKASSKNTLGDNTDNGFLGEKGNTVKAIGDKIYIDESNIDDGNMHSFNYFSEKKGKNIYFFIVKASDGTYRAAANACEVCFGSKKGFKQVGDLIRCENCQVTYSKDKIALQKGGCNPGPINPDVKVDSGKLVIDTSDIDNVAYLF